MVMKRFLLLFAVATVVAIGVGQAWAAHTLTDDWSSDPYFTTQTWTFDTPTSMTAQQYITGNAVHTGVVSTMAIDTSATSPATYMSNGAAVGFVDAANQPCTGIWSIAGAGSTDDKVVGTFTIPNTATTNPGYLRLTAVVQTNNANFGDYIHTRVYNHGTDLTPGTTVTDANRGVKDTDWYYPTQDYSVTPINAGYGVVSVTLPYFSIAGMGSNPTVVISSQGLATGDYVRFDSVRIDTTPEPGTVAMLIAGAVALLGWAGRRWIRK
jgi:hypothetical protein